jgi:hypothetical protein
MPESKKFKNWIPVFTGMTAISISEQKAISFCSGKPYFNCHTGVSRYPGAEFSLKIWIPAFAGMTFYSYPSIPNKY